MKDSSVLAFLPFLKRAKFTLSSKTINLSVLTLLMLSNSILAESYQSLSALKYSYTEFGLEQSSADTFSFDSQYYFDERKTLGPLNEFSYINNISNVYVSTHQRNSDWQRTWQDLDYSSESRSNFVSVGGEWVINNFIIGGSYGYQKEKSTYNNYTYNAWTGSFDKPQYVTSYDDTSHAISLSLGYLISDNFVISTSINGIDEEENGFSTFNASYNVQLNDSDYVGFSYNVDESFEFHSLSSRYFVAVAQESYLVVGGDFSTFQGDHNSFNYWGINASYYYNANASISASYRDNKTYDISAEYFINRNYSLSVGYNSVLEENDARFEFEGYFISLNAQF